MILLKLRVYVSQTGHCPVCITLLKQKLAILRHCPVMPCPNCIKGDIMAPGGSVISLNKPFVNQPFPVFY